ncbi:OBSCN protein, partial [Atrichornis clamosus]|nr:OBSCN protein [Atrichornis clamosus]
KCHSKCINQDLTQASIKAPVASFPSLLALPVLFKKQLRDEEAEEGTAVKFQCELTKDNAAVEWRKGTMELFPCAKYEIKLSGRTAELVIHNVEPEDA